MSALVVDGLTARLGSLKILDGVDLRIPFGEVHALMGPNGSGKSTLCHVLAGKPDYEVDGSARLGEIELTELPTDRRARSGLFTTFQYPVDIPGITLGDLLAEMRHGAPDGFDGRVERLSAELGIQRFWNRPVNQGLSGGEKKRSEIFQLLAMAPRAAVLDEIDSGLDIDAVREVAAELERLRSPDRAVVLITHYSRILRYVRVDGIHVMVGGRIVESGGAELADRLEAEGYDELRRRFGVAPAKDADPFADL